MATPEQQATTSLTRLLQGHCNGSPVEPGLPTHLGLCLCVLRFGDESELLHHAQNIVVVPALRYLAIGEPRFAFSRKWVDVKVVKEAAALGEHSNGFWRRLLWEGS